MGEIPSKQCRSYRIPVHNRKQHFSLFQVDFLVVNVDGFSSNCKVKKLVCRQYQYNIADIPIPEISHTEHPY